MAKNVLHHNDAGVDYDAEVDRTQRTQVGGRVGQMQQGERAQQRQGNVDRGNDRGPEVADKENQHQEDQRDADTEVLLDGAQRRLDQPGAIIIGNDLEAPGQDAGAVETGDLLVDSLQSLERVSILAHQNDAFDDLVATVHAHYAQAGSITRADLGHVADPDWK